MRSAGRTRLRWSVQRRSKRMPAAAIEQMMIGHMNGPPARTISHMARDHTGSPRKGSRQAPEERMARRAGGRDDRDSALIEAEHEAALATDVPNPAAGIPPARQRGAPGVRVGATRRHRDLCAQRLYPLRA